MHGHEMDASDWHDAHCGLAVTGCHGCHRSIQIVYDSDFFSVTLNFGCRAKGGTGRRGTLHCT